ncbi:MAG: Rab family GTPase [Promethearchaeota archaeon]
MIIRQVKVIFAGDGAVGKTALVKRFTTGQYGDAESYKMTIGVNIATYNGKRNGTQLCLAVWDLGGQQRFDFIRRQFYIGAEIVVFVYDVTTRASFQNLVNWIDEVEKSCKTAYKGLLIGNKIDLDEFRVIDFEEAKIFAEAYGMTYLETSARNNTGIENLIKVLTDYVVMDSPHKLVKQIEVAS